MSGWVEKRAYQRVGFLCRVDVEPPGGGPAIEASTIDISLGGVGIVSPRLVAAGTPVSLVFRLRDKQGAPASERVAGRVAHARSDVDGHLLGIEYHQPLRKDANPLLTRAVERL